MNQIACPSEEQLRDYILGKLPEDVAEQTERHIQVCQACEATAESLETQADSLIEQIRQRASDDPYLAEPQCQVAVARAKLLAGEVVLGEGPSKDLAPSQPADLGRLGEYQLLAKLGEGGMGAVYKARQTRLSKIVALKVLPEDRTTDPRAVARFEREMEAVGQLSHPNIVQAHDARDIEGTTVLVMEYVDGKDLSHVVRRLGMLAIADACEIARQTALGLQAAHARGLVHRDIKPSNLMLSREGQVKILDLGLARLETEKREGVELTSSGAAMGTADYMAPEQATDAHAADARADIYSLGCTLYKLLTGHAPFSGPKYPTKMKKMLAHISEPVPPVRGLRADVPEALATVIDHMLAKRPEDRFLTAAEVVAALAPFAVGCDLARLSAEATADDTVAREQSSVGTDRHASSSLVATDAGGSVKFFGLHTTPWFKKPRNLRIAVGGAALFAGVLLGVLIVLQTREGTLKIVADGTNVQVAVKQGGEVVEVVDAQSGWKIIRKPGEYELAIQGSTDKFQLERNSVTVRRGETVTVKVTLKRAAPVPHSPSLIPPQAVAPFDSAKAKEHQEAWAKHLGVPVAQTNTLGMPLVLIPPGEFDMGTTAEEVARVVAEGREGKWCFDRMPVEVPRHRVKITKPHYMAIYPVTQAEYENIVGANPSTFTEKQIDASAFKPPLGPQTEDRAKIVTMMMGKDTRRHPVETVNWNESLEFCRKLSALPAERAARRTYRLPTEAEWEYACRAGTTTRWFSGDDDAKVLEYAWCNANAHGMTHPVGEKKPNAWGLYDMHGNVNQWCSDWFGADFYKHSPATDPTGPSSGYARVWRGGNWLYPASGCRSAFRLHTEPDGRTSYFGFRIVMDVPADLHSPEKTTISASPLKLDPSVSAIPAAGETIVNERDGSSLVLIPAGKFLAGEEKNLPWASPVRMPAIWHLGGLEYPLLAAGKK